MEWVSKWPSRRGSNRFYAGKQNAVAGLKHGHHPDAAENAGADELSFVCHGGIRHLKSVSKCTHWETASKRREKVRRVRARLVAREGENTSVPQVCVDSNSTRESTAVELPSVHAFNLTNGLELLPRVVPLLNSQQCEFHTVFTRIQSTLCEQALYDKLIMELDHSILMPLALGQHVYVYDVCSRNKKRGVPRAIWYGVEFVRYALVYYWHGKDSPLLPPSVLLRGKDVVSFWRGKVLPYVLSKTAKKKLRYYKPYVSQFATEKVHLYGVYGGVAENDGDYDWYASNLREWMARAAVRSSSCQSKKTQLKLKWDGQEWEKRLEKIGLSVFDSTHSCDRLRAEQRKRLNHFA